MTTAIDGMSLTELRRKYPALFYAQGWFDGEAFMRTVPNEIPFSAPSVSGVGRIPEHPNRLPLAVELAHAYVRTPRDPVWERYLWCRDVDGQGQRIYVGGTANGHGFEIHRHLHITDRFGVPVWP